MPLSEDLLDPDLGQINQPIQVAARVASLLRRGLRLHEAPVTLRRMAVRPLFTSLISREIAP